MKLRPTTPKDGVQWMLGGVRLVRREPLALAGLFSLMVFGLGLVMGLPWIGPVAVGVLLPALTAGWVEVARAMQAGQRPAPQQLLGPLRSASARPALLKLGGLHALCALLMLTLGDLIDPGLDAAWQTMRDPDASSEATLQAIGSLQQAVVLRSALLLPVALTFWHAPAILVRTGVSVGQALFVSANASWRNLGAFVVYGLCWIGADLVLSVLLGGLLGALGLGPAAMLVVLPGALLFSAAFYASLQGSIDGCLDLDA
jgi:hypothetical protein